MFPKEIEWRTHLMERVFLSLFFLVAAEPTILGLTLVRVSQFFSFASILYWKVERYGLLYQQPLKMSLKQREKGENKI